FPLLPCPIGDPCRHHSQTVERHLHRVLQGEKHRHLARLPLLQGDMSHQKGIVGQDVVLNHEQRVGSIDLQADGVSHPCRDDLDHTTAWRSCPHCPPLSVCLDLPLEPEGKS